MEAQEFGWHLLYIRPYYRTLVITLPLRKTCAINMLTDKSTHKKLVSSNQNVKVAPQDIIKWVIV